MEAQVNWPQCRKCDKTILRHHLWGWLAYCTDDVREPETQSTFTVHQVNDVRRTLGHPISDEARAKERREGWAV